jgi:triacylglycerol lipase
VTALALSPPAPALAAGGWALLGLALAALLALGLALLARSVRARLRRLQRRVRRRAPRYPVVLAHGFMGFDEVRLPGGRADYFRGIPHRLAREGYLVHRPRVHRTASVRTRAAELSAFLEGLPPGRVNLVAHSMGGLDARLALAAPRLASRVASLVTVGTPHLGTPLADMGAAAGMGWLLPGLALLGLDLEALQDLTTARMRAFNREVADAPDVLYGSVVGVAPRRAEVSPLLLASWGWLADRAGPSDGVVPASAQGWGTVLRTIEADHWAQIGWSRAFDAPAFYVDLLAELRGLGL